MAFVVGRNAALVVAASCAADDPQHLLPAATLRVLSSTAISFFGRYAQASCAFHLDTIVINLVHATQQSKAGGPSEKCAAARRRVLPLQQGRELRREAVAHRRWELRRRRGGAAHRHALIGGARVEVVREEHVARRAGPRVRAWCNVRDLFEALARGAR